MNKNIIAGISILLLNTLACEPVIAIGWKEILFAVILLAFLFGPPVYRLIRRIENSLKQKDK